MHKMKKIILIVFPLVALCCGTVVAQADADKIWDDANTAYINADYVAAIDGYEKLLDSGLESDRLYLNLGNAYFKRGMNGKAILNYNRALKLAPSDDDIRYNLSIANAYVQDKIDAVPVFFAKRWLIGLGNSLSSNAWAALSLLFFALTLVGLGAYLLLRRVALLRGFGFRRGVRAGGRLCGRRAQPAHPSRRGDRDEYGGSGQEFARSAEQGYFRIARGNEGGGRRFAGRLA